MSNVDIDMYAGNAHAELIIDSLVTNETVKFLAFLTSFNQTFSSNWNSEVVYGRADPIGNFQGTQRTISLGWDVPAGDLLTAGNNLGQINSLTKMLYPYYKSTAQEVEIKPEEGDAGPPNTVTVGANALAISKPPLVRLQFGNLIKNIGGSHSGLLGWIGSFSWTPAINMGMFTDGKGMLYPKVIGLSIDFTVQHEHFLGTNDSGGPPATFPFGG